MIGRSFLIELNLKTFSSLFIVSWQKWPLSRHVVHLKPLVFVAQIVCDNIISVDLDQVPRLKNERCSFGFVQSLLELIDFGSSQLL